MSTINAPMRVGQFAEPFNTNYPDDPDGYPSTRCRLDGDTAGNFDAILRAFLRVCAWHIKVKYTTQVYTLDLDNNPVFQGGATEGTYEADIQSTTSPQNGIGPNPLTEITALQLVNSGELEYVNKSASGDIITTLLALLLVNNKPANGDFPFYYSFTLICNCPVSAYGQSGSLSFGTVVNYDASNDPGDYFPDGLTFLGTADGPQTWDILSGTESFQDPQVAPTPPPGQPSTQQYTMVKFESAEITEKNVLRLG